MSEIRIKNLLSFQFQINFEFRNALFASLQFVIAGCSKIDENLNLDITLFEKLDQAISVKRVFDIYLPDFISLLKEYELKYSFAIFQLILKDIGNTREKKPATMQNTVRLTPSSLLITLALSNENLTRQADQILVITDSSYRILEEFFPLTLAKLTQIEREFLSDSRLEEIEIDAFNASLNAL